MSDLSPASKIRRWDARTGYTRGLGKAPSSFAEPHGSVSASEVQAILDATDWDKFWKDVADDSAPEIEAYEKAEARSKRTNRFIR